MAVKNTAQVIIGGKIITLGGYESEEYFQQVASYMNKKIGELETVPGYGRQPMETKHMLLSSEHYRRLLQGEEAGGDL
ncbi:MAG: cell division protein ZapA [Ruminococcus sp.]